MEEQFRRLDVNGANLAYQVHGDGVGSPALVFCHGYAMRSSGPAYRALIPLLAEHFTVYALDLRGHGASASETADWSLTTIADDVAGFVERLGLTGAVYAGHSIGGFTGMFSQIRHPGTFSALCLLATAPASGGSYTPPEIGTLITEKATDRTAMFELFTGMYVRPNREEVAHAVDAIGLMNRSIHEAFFPTFPAVVLTPQLEKVRVPTLVLCGARDVVVPPAEQHKTALGLALCKEVTFSGDGHMLPIESAASTAREIVNFCTYDVSQVFGR